MTENDYARLVELYRDWNAKINVISRKDIDNVYEHHVLHSLAIAEYVRRFHGDDGWKAGESVLDYGCGTGILAIAAKKLGAGDVLGTDIDPQAVEAAIDNSKANEAPATFVLPKDMPEGTFDIVVANILSNPLKLLAPALLARVKPQGHLVLSGVLARQAEEVIEVYRQADPSVKLSVWKENEGWVCIAGTKQ